MNGLINFLASASSPRYSESSRDSTIESTSKFHLDFFYLNLIEFANSGIDFQHKTTFFLEIFYIIILWFEIGWPCTTSDHFFIDSWKPFT